MMLNACAQPLRHPGEQQREVLLPTLAPRQFPHFSGRWTHCDPVWNFQAIASITSRWSRHRPPSGRPARQQRLDPRPLHVA